ncbi:unnamed protein product [Adineta ricciae]|uniref:Peptidase M14 domain-containing protein n=1 Tax=Adineta ricciae TaxID=249248 RepID=A0A816A9M1_ADIRI|nr:unnamed protein product [Adineta ricciae]
MIHTVVLFLFLNILQAEHVWFVKFPSKDNYLSHIEKSFPLIDLIQHDYNDSSYVFLLPSTYRTKFRRLIDQANGSYRILSNNARNTWKASPDRPKRSILSDNPLDESYYQRFPTYDEQQEWQQLLQSSPQTQKLIRLHTIGQTYENRSLTVVQIHTNYPRRIQGRRKRKQAIFIDGGMHAREWLSVGVANYILIQFLLQRENDPKVHEILRHFDIFVLPMMNPDGYEYSRTHNRLWRKNRSPTSHSEFWNGDQNCYGVDLNRNFPYQWNSTYGASSHPCSHSYRGISPASESEVESVVNFLRRQRLSHPKFYAYFNLHSYGRFWLLPWTYTMLERVTNYDELFERSTRIANEVMNQTYRVGQASFLLYPCSGTSIDFASTFMSHAMTFELSPIFQGLPMCVEQNKTVNHGCTVGFLIGPENIEIDGKEIFKAIIEYLYALVQDHFV